MNAISLFSGVGGLDIGVNKAGFEVKVAIENDPNCVKTLLRNLKETKIISKDIRKIEGFKEGSKIVLLAFDDHIEIRPLSYTKRANLTKESILNYIMSEGSLAKDWLTDKEDEAWKNL